MLILAVARVRWDSGEACCLCKKFLNPGQSYARTESKVAHYKCAKKAGWRRKSRAKKKPKPIIEREVNLKMIRVVRNGETVKTVPQ